MKKILAVFLVVLSLTAIAVPTFAVTPTLNIPSMPNISGIKFDFSNINFNATVPDSSEDATEATEPEGTEDATEEVDGSVVDTAKESPVITESRYFHATRWVKGHLNIQWDAIEGAEGYEVLITKADGETISYTTDKNTLYQVCGCPRVYIEKTSTWASAKVVVRAIFSNCVSPWSEESAIGCNMLHM